MKNKRLIYIILAIVLVAGFLFIRNSSEAGKDFTDSVISAVAGENETAASASSQGAAPTAEEKADAAAPVQVETEIAEEANDSPAPESEAAGLSAGHEATKPAAEEAVLDEDGVYDSKEDVALYLHLYHHLPSNFITKNEAKDKGWSGSGGDKLDKYCPGKCIGGDYFGNYENILPKGKYRECDIDTLGQKSRGVKRIVFSSDWHIYYTEDHYESFELLYEP